MRETLVTSQANQYFSVDGLRILTGMEENEWPLVILKELIDNALDAVDQINKDKTIFIDLHENGITVWNSGVEIEEEDLKTIHDFKVFVSSTHLYRLPTRGAQGNALKTLIGLAYVTGGKLTFHFHNKDIVYHPDEAKIKASIISFNKEVIKNENEMFGVTFSGIPPYLNTISRVWFYSIFNPDVTFKIKNVQILQFLKNPNEGNYLLSEGEKNEKFAQNEITVFDAKVLPVSKAVKKPFVHWHSIESFNNLLQAIAMKHSSMTTKEFVKVFGNTRGVLSSLTNFPKKIKNFKEENVSKLYNFLIENCKIPGPVVLKTAFLQESLSKQLRIYKFKKACGFQQGSSIPVVVQGALVKWDSSAECICGINNSVPYGLSPFSFNYKRVPKFFKPHLGTNNFGSILKEFYEAEGVAIILHVISPYFEFLDKAKSNIIGDRFSKLLLKKVLEPLAKPVIREVRRTKREAKAQDSATFIHHKTPPKKTLMKKHFKEAFERASGGYLVTARQVYYVLHEIINRKYGISLNDSDYNILTQQICTEMAKKDDKVEVLLLFENRGRFKDPLGKEVPLGTKDVRKHIRNIHTNSICHHATITYDLDDRYMFNKALFVEKNGISIILEQVGLLKKMNLAIMSSQGFGNRASKELINHLLEQDITVYALSDCDIHGYRIFDRLAYGSKTYEKELKVKRLGLTVGDIKELNKIHLAEEKQYKKPVRDTSSLTDEEKEFFFIEPGNFYKLRRVELNALTTPELIAFIKKHIPEEPLIPPEDVLSGCIQIPPQEVIKEALYNAFQDELNPDVSIDYTYIIQKVREKTINQNTNWLNVIGNVVDEYKQKLVSILAKKIKRGIKF